MKPIPVVVLSYNRPAHLVITLKSFGRNCKFKRGFREIYPTYLVVQDYPIIKKDIEEHIKQKDLPIITDMHVFPENLGAAAGYNKGMEMALEQNPDYVLFLEDDWVSIESLSKNLSKIMYFMDNHPEVGQMRLRSMEEQVSRKERMTAKKIIWEESEIPNIYISDAHWTFNPCITRASVIRDMDPTGYGIHAIRNYHKLEMRTAKYVGYCFAHIGYQRAVTEEGGKTVWKR